MARQTAVGLRAAAPLIGGLAGGGAEGINLTPSAKRVLHAQQLLCVIQATGALVTAPPTGELPPESSYPPPLVGASPAATPYPWLAPPAWPSGTPDGSQLPLSYTTLQRRNAAAARRGQQRERPVQSAQPGKADNLYIPYSLADGSRQSES